nr:hypothetical protein [Anaerolineae bacterium]
MTASQSYHRYHIQTQNIPDVVRWPNRFRVRVKKLGLISYMIRSAFHYKFDTEVFLARPCIYGVFSRPVGGLAPIQEKCVACLRCTVSHPDFVRIERNPAREQLGDSFFTAHHVDAVSYEAQTGRIPVKGAGYRGKFGGEGWDGIWTDMSEIVRPTRDGIHGREYISTAVDIGVKPDYLDLDTSARPFSTLPRTFSLPVPILFDTLAGSDNLLRTLVEAAMAVDTLVVIPLDDILRLGVDAPCVVPLVTPEKASQVVELNFIPRLLQIEGWSESAVQTLRAALPDTQICLRLPFSESPDYRPYIEAGIGIFHLTTDYHGCISSGAFIFDLIRAAHLSLVEQGLRDRVTLLGSGGICAAEHVPKAIIAGLDAVALDTPLLVAIQGRFEGEFVNADSRLILPRPLPPGWAAGRITNLVAAWRDQL